MPNEVIASAQREFSVDGSMSEEAAMAAIARLCATIREEADVASAAAEDEAQDPDGTFERQADVLEDLLGELENITIDLDSEGSAQVSSTLGGRDAIGEPAAREVNQSVMDAFKQASLDK